MYTVAGLLYKYLRRDSSTFDISPRWTLTRNSKPVHLDSTRLSRVADHVRPVHRAGGPTAAGNGFHALQPEVAYHQGKA